MRENRSLSRATFRSLKRNFRLGEILISLAPLPLLAIAFCCDETREILNNRHHIRDRSNEIEILCEEIFSLIKFI